MMTVSSDTPVEFVVSYDGPALAEHTIPVRDLAPALLALGQAFERANSILNGDRASISLEIRATAEGSFEIGLLLKQLFDTAVDAFSSDFVQSAANMKELLIGGGGITVGLFGLIKWLKGSRPKEVERTDDGNITLEIDRLRLKVPARVLDLYKDSNLRNHIEAVVRPLARPGIDKITFLEDQQPLETVEKAEIPYFEPEESADVGPTKMIIPRQRLQLASVSFVKGKWKLSDGEKTRWNAIKDDQFNDQVEQGQLRFGTGDMLICEVVMAQSIEANGELKLEYEITTVLRHIPRPLQGRMLDDDGLT